MRLIDADALIANKFKNDISYNAFVSLVKRQPTVQETKAGRWIDCRAAHTINGEERKARKCSVCGVGYFVYDLSENVIMDVPNFCPNCGAEMKGGEDGD